MSFLAPAFLLGALAIALPIIFHLIRRTTREKTNFSSLMFLTPTPPRVTRRSRLENIWLLLLRCLVLGLLALGFARPFIQKAMTSDPASGAGTRTVVLLDTSASMRRGQLWKEAQSRAIDLVQKARPADQISILAFDQQIRTLLTFDEWNKASLSERQASAIRVIQEQSVGWGATQLGNALLSASELFSDVTRKQNEGEKKRIVVISDLQQGSHLEKVQGHEWPQGLNVQLEHLKSGKTINAGIQLLAEREDSNDTDVKVRVTNAANSKQDTFQLGWANPKGGGFLGAATPVYVPAGQSRIFPAPKLPPNTTGDRLMLAGDGEEFDNTAFVVPLTAEKIQILFLGKDAENDPAQLLFYLKRAFQQTKRQEVNITSKPLETPLLKGDLDLARVLILAGIIPDSQHAALEAFLEQGKTIVYVTKSASDAATLARLAAVPNVGLQEAVVGNYAMLGQIDFEHPLFAPFSDPRFSDFTKIHFWKYRKLSPESLPKAHVLARFEKGDPALIQVPRGRGNLLVLTSGWHPADSQLALSSKFVPLLYSILEQSGSRTVAKTQYYVADEIPMPTVANTATLKVRKPDGVETTASQTFSGATAPGVYQVVAENGLRSSFAVNLLPDESRTAPLTAEEFQKLGVPLQQFPTAAARLEQQKQRHLQAMELENRQKLWRWLIVAALMVLICETWLAGWLTRRAAPQAEAGANA